MIKTSTMAAPKAATARPGAELPIKTAAAGVREGAPAPRVGTLASRAPPSSAQPAGEQPERSGTAMLLAALALMSGIALRRYGANKQ